jgi:hypothetical protein
MKKTILLIILMLPTLVMAQYNEKLPYYQIPEYPESYTAGTVAARMVDGLGFRYYWATEGLRDEDLSYKISESSRTSAETIEHIYGLSKFIRNNILENDKDKNESELNFEDKRKQTLLNFKIVSDVLRNIDEPLNLDETGVPFWNIINGPIADALWHCGQVVMMRRASGNPFNSKVSVFSGKLKE